MPSIQQTGSIFDPTTVPNFFLSVECSSHSLSQHSNALLDCSEWSEKGKSAQKETRAFYETSDGVLSRFSTSELELSRKPSIPAITNSVCVHVHIRILRLGRVIQVLRTSIRDQDFV